MEIIISKNALAQNLSQGNRIFLQCHDLFSRMRSIIQRSFGMIGNVLSNFFYSCFQIDKECSLRGSFIPKFQTMPIQDLSEGKLPTEVQIGKNFWQQNLGSRNLKVQRCANFALGTQGIRSQVAGFKECFTPEAPSKSLTSLETEENSKNNLVERVEQGTQTVNFSDVSQAVEHYLPNLDSILDDLKFHRYNKI